MKDWLKQQAMLLAYSAVWLAIVVVDAVRDTSDWELDR